MAVRSLVAALSAAALVAGVAGCSSDDPDPEASDSPTPAASSGTDSATPEVTDLEVAVYGDLPRVETYRRMVAAYSRQHPNVKVRLQTYPDAAAASTAALSALSSGEGPDVFLADQYALPDLVDTGRLQPVDTLLEDRGLQFGDDYQRSGLTAFSANNRLQCMPAEMSPLVVYVNNRLVPKRRLRLQGVNVPSVRQPTWGWEDFLTIAQVAAGSDLLGPVKGAAVPFDLETLTAFVRSAGGEVVDDPLEPTSLTLASDDALQALTSVLQVTGEPSLAPTSEELRRRDAIARFDEGELGMFVGTRDDLPRLRAATKLKFDVWPLPSMGRARTVATANGFCIDTASDAVDAAADFVAFAVGPRGADIASASGVMVPSLVAAVHGQAFLQPLEPPKSAEMYGVSLRRTEPMPYSAAWPEVSALADRTLQRLLELPPAERPAALEALMTRLDTRSEKLFAEGVPPDGG